MPLLDHDGQIRELLSRARTVAVVGLSDSPGRDSHSIGLYLLEAGYEVIPVNPTVPSVFGIPCVPDLEHLAGRNVDIADVFRRPQHAAAIVRGALRATIGALWFQFGTSDPDAIRTAVSAGLGVVSERCIMVEHARLFPRP